MIPSFSKIFCGCHSESQNLDQFVSQRDVNLRQFVKDHFPKTDLTKNVTAREISEINYAMTKESFNISKQALIKTVEEYHQLFLPDEIATMILEYRPKIRQGKLGHLFGEDYLDAVPLQKSNLIAFLSTQDSISIFNPSNDYEKAFYTLPMPKELKTIKKLTPLPNNQLGAVDENNLYIWDLNHPKKSPAILNPPLPLTPDSLVSIGKHHVALRALGPSRTCVVYILNLVALRALSPSRKRVVYILDLNDRPNLLAVLPKPYDFYPHISKFRHDGFFSLCAGPTQTEFWNLKNLKKPFATIGVRSSAHPFIQLEDENFFASVVTLDNLNHIAIWNGEDPKTLLYSFPAHLIQSNFIQLKHGGPFNGCIAQCSINHAQRKVISIWKIEDTEKPALTIKLDFDHNLHTHFHLMELSDGTLLAASRSHIYMWNLNRPKTPTTFDVSATVMAQEHAPTPYKPIERADGSLFVCKQKKAFTIT